MNVGAAPAVGRREVACSRAGRENREPVKRQAKADQAGGERAQWLARGAAEVISLEELASKLAQGRALRVKLGMDPTRPDLHLGHSITLKKLRDFQDDGHTVVFLVGDFTATIGDPTGRSQARPPLSRQEVAANAETYRTQVFKLLDPSRTEVRFNSEWMDQLGVRDLIGVAATVSVARLLERDDFEKRLAEREPLFVHELLYPLIQGYDSFALKADVELGGTDQKFNMLAGREIQRALGQPPQVVMTFPMLEGLDGARKMSKSLGNYVALSEQPEEMFGKLMSISDRLMVRYYELLAALPAAELQRIKSGALHPMEAKKRLAAAIVAEYHGAEAAARAQSYFETKFQRRQVPAGVPQVKLEQSTWICELLRQLGFVASTSEARRLIGQGAVRLDGEKVADVNFQLVPGRHALLEVGKRRVARLEQ